MDINEFRQQFPEYNDVDDTTLTRKLHQNHYQDMSYEEFAKRFSSPVPTPVTEMVTARPVAPLSKSPVLSDREIQDYQNFMSTRKPSLPTIEYDPIMQAAKETVEEGKLKPVKPKPEPKTWDVGGDIQIGAMQALKGILRIPSAIETDIRDITYQPKTGDMTPIGGTALDVLGMSDISRGLLKGSNQLQTMIEKEQEKQKPLSFYKEGTPLPSKEALPYVIRSITQSSPQMAAAFALSIATGSPYAGPAMFFATTKADEEMRMIQAGESPEKARNYSNLYGWIEGGTEMLVFPELFKATGGIPFRQFVNILAENAGQEAAAGFLEGATGVFEKNSNPDGTMKEGVKINDVMKEAAIEGAKRLAPDALAGLGMALPSAGTGLIAESIKETQNGVQETQTQETEQVTPQVQEIMNQGFSREAAESIAASMTELEAEEEKRDELVAQAGQEAAARTTEAQVAASEQGLAELAREQATKGKIDVKLQQQGITPQEAEAMTDDEMAYALADEQERKHLESINQEAKYTKEQKAEIGRVLAETTPVQREDVSEQGLSELKQESKEEQEQAKEESQQKADVAGQEYPPSSSVEAGGPPPAAPSLEVTPELINPSTEKGSSKQKGMRSGKLDYSGIIETGEAAVETTKDFVSDAKLAMDKVFVPISHRLENINPGLFRSVREHANVLMLNIKNALDQIDPWLKFYRKLPKKTQIRIKNFLNSGELSKAEAILEKTGGIDVYRRAMDAKQDIFRRARAAGVKMEALLNHYPRSIKNMRKFMKAIQDQTRRSAIEDALKARANKYNRSVDSLTDREIEDAINSLMRGFSAERIFLGRPGHAKERSVDYTSGLEKFYHDPDQALVNYVTQMEKAIADNLFFNKTSEDVSNLKRQDTRARNRLAAVQKTGQNPTDAALAVAQAEKALSDKMEELEIDRSDSIGKIVRQMRDRGKLTYDQEGQVKDMLQAYFSRASHNSFLNGWMNLTYGLTLGNSLLHNLTQLSEIGMGLIEDTQSFIPSVARAAVRKSSVKWSDLGGDIYSRELREFDVYKIVDKMLHINLWADVLGKDILSDAAWQKAKRQAQKPNKSFIDRLRLYFGDDFKNVLNDMKKGQVTPEVKQYLLNVVADFQPISRAEMPEAYLKHPVLKPFYALKMFTIKRANATLQLAKRDFKAGRHAQGVARMAAMVAILSALGAGTQLLKDFLRGKPLDDESFTDRMFDELLRWVLYSRYQMDRGKHEGFIKMFISGFAPFTPLIGPADAALRGDMDKFIKEFSRNIPFAGDIYYWWFDNNDSRTNERQRRR